MEITVDSSVVNSVIRKVREEGGFAYAATVKQAGQDFQSAEAAREMAWEQLHCGPWHDVGQAWRDAYSMACLYVAAFKVRKGELKEAMKIVDMGVIMGGEGLRRESDKAIREIRDALARNEEGKESGEERWNMGMEMSLPEVRHLLPFKSLLNNIVEKQSSPSMEKFLCDYFLVGSPVVLVDCIDHWPACTKWKDIKYLKRIAGERTVPVEVGKNYLCPKWKTELIRFSDFLERILSNECNPENRTYLAQHPLFDQIQELRTDIMMPDYCFTGGGELQSLNAWFGPAETVTPLHHDPHHNLLAQVVGRKYVRLYPASITEDLYPFSESMLKNSSQVDLDKVDTNLFPKVQDLEFLDCILEEGEMLYIPPKWWHYVKSLTTSFSVSFWWASKKSNECEPIHASDATTGDRQFSADNLVSDV